jgi:hypothetical protein
VPMITWMSGRDSTCGTLTLTDEFPRGLRSYLQRSIHDS